MLELVIIAVAILVLLIGGLALWRWADDRADRVAWSRLAATQPHGAACFHPAMVEGLPEPAQRYFRHAIRPGTPLMTVAEISMSGQLSLGSKDGPNFMPMRARQILAGPAGLVWRVDAGRGAMRVSGSDAALDGQSWSRFWLWGLVPVGRAGGTADHARSAFGRCVAEAVFWTPAAVLPGEGVTWQAVDETTARVTISRGDLRQAVDVAVDRGGRPLTVSFRRWSNANPERRFRPQPFGGTLSDFKEFGGFCLPTRVDAGNFFGTEDYFPFFRAKVTDIRFPPCR